MTHLRSLFAALGLAVLAGAALAATSPPFSVVFIPPTSATVTCTPLGPIPVPAAVGTVIANCNVLPAGWTGTMVITLNGAPTTLFGVSGTNVVVGAAAYNTVGTAGPFVATTTP